MTIKTRFNTVLCAATLAVVTLAFTVSSASAAPITVSSYTYEVGTPHTSWPDTGGTELTDGLIATTTFNGGDAAKLVSFLDPTEPHINFDLGGKYAVDTIDLSYWEGGRWAPSEIHISSSEDGTTYSTPITIAVGNGATSFDVANLDVSTVPDGQFYRLEFDRAGQWLFFTELEFDGALATPPTPPSNNVPEPASIAIWSILGICLAGYGYRRRRRNS